MAQRGAATAAGYLLIAAGVTGVNIVNDLTVDTDPNSYRLGYQDALPRPTNPLEDVPEGSWPSVIDRAVAECEEDWETGADHGGPDWKEYCAGQYAGWADRLRGTYEPVDASWDGLNGAD